MLGRRGKLECVVARLNTVVHSNKRLQFGHHTILLYRDCQIRHISNVQQDVVWNAIRLSPIQRKGVYRMESMVGRMCVGVLGTIVPFYLKAIANTIAERCSWDVHLADTS